MRRRTKWGIGLVAVLVLLWWFVSGVMNPVVKNYAAAQLDALTIQAVNCGVTKVVDANTYHELTVITRNPKGQITGVSADVVAMNHLAAAISTYAQESLQSLGRDRLPVPLGTFSGIPLLVGRGVPLKLQLDLIGAVNCRFDSAFSSAGINQTQHKIILYADALVDLVLPLGHHRTQISVQMLFADNIIVGEVPEFLFTKSLT